MFSIAWIQIDHIPTRDRCTLIFFRESTLTSATSANDRRERSEREPNARPAGIFLPIRTFAASLMNPRPFPC